MGRGVAGRLRQIYVKTGGRKSRGPESGPLRGDIGGYRQFGYGVGPWGVTGGVSQ